MRIKLIACEALYRECCRAAAASQHVVDLKFTPFGLHNTPSELRATIQAEIDASDSVDYVALGYGLCSRGTAELRSGAAPLVIPRAHDCITLFLGSRTRYNEQFTTSPGTYYYSAGWVERMDGEVQQGLVEDAHAKQQEDRYREYVEKYGEDNAKFLMEQEAQWSANYTRAAFIDTGVGDPEIYRRFTQQIARGRGWDYAELPGDTSLIDRLLSGDWNEDFLIVQPGRGIIESFDELILKSES